MLRIKLSCTRLKSDSHPKTLNLWSITPYKNIIKCLWMPFFLIHFCYKYGKRGYSTVQVRETNIILMSDGRGGIVFLYKLQKYIKWKKLLPPHLNHHKHRNTAMILIETECIEMHHGYTKMSIWKHLLPILSYSAVWVHLFVHSMTLSL